MPESALARVALRAPLGAARRRWLLAAGAALAGLSSLESAPASEPPTETAATTAPPPLTVYTFGDSILDCGHYNDLGLTPGMLLVRNDDARFPEFRGRDLQSLGPTRLVHGARDGATVDGLGSQRPAGPTSARSIGLLTVGGNDLLRGLASDTGPGLREFERKLLAFLETLALRPMFIGNVYDPTFGDDQRNFLGVPAGIARANHRRVNEIIASAAARHGRLVDMHAHFLHGSPAWFTRTIEPSLQGASEVRRVFLDAIAPLGPQRRR